MINCELLRRADYSKPQTIKRLLMSMSFLFSLAEQGDTVAHSIYIDLKNALTAEGVLSVKQRKYLLLWMAGYEQNQIAWASGTYQRAVSREVHLGISNIIKFLRDI